jgi:hypothetical protein
LFALLVAPVISYAEMTAERSDRGVVIKLDGELFTEDLTKAGQSPALWPIIGPGGRSMTRSYPVGPTVEGETDDHPHHQSLWVTHDQVNGADFWKENVNQGKDENGARIIHRDFVEVESEGATARVVTRNDWMNGDKRICEDQRTIVFGTGAGSQRWIDYTIVLKPSDGEVTFGDTKEGTFAVRVADTMRVDAKLGGRIVNSEGHADEAAWGMPARWVDYSGPVDGETVGVTIMSHPDSFRPAPRWHVRTYGLFTANPFGQRDFPSPEAASQGPVTVQPGDSLTLRYRVVLHEGDADAANIEQAYAEFIGGRLATHVHESAACCCQKRATQIRRCGFRHRVRCKHR